MNIEQFHRTCIENDDPKPLWRALRAVRDYRDFERLLGQEPAAAVIPWGGLGSSLNPWPAMSQEAGAGVEVEPWCPWAAMSQGGESDAMHPWPAVSDEATSDAMPPWPAVSQEAKSDVLHPWSAGAIEPWHSLETEVTGTMDTTHS